MRQRVRLCTWHGSSRPKNARRGAIDSPGSGPRMQRAVIRQSIHERACNVHRFVRHYPEMIVSGARRKDPLLLHDHITITIEFVALDLEYPCHRNQENGTQRKERQRSASPLSSKKKGACDAKTPKHEERADKGLHPLARCDHHVLHLVE